MQFHQKLIFACLTIALAGLLVGCHEDHSAHGDHANHLTAESAHGLSLNGEAKWQSDSHTRMVMASIGELLRNEPAEDLEAFSSTAAQVDTEVDKLIAGCTMEGEAHHQLHKFLSAFIPRVKGLKSETDLKAARETHHQLQQLLTDYHAHFE